jgi:hypothetical protein
VFLVRGKPKRPPAANCAPYCTWNKSSTFVCTRFVQVQDEECILAGGRLFVATNNGSRVPFNMTTHPGVFAGANQCQSRMHAQRRQIFAPPYFEPAQKRAHTFAAAAHTHTQCKGSLSPSPKQAWEHAAPFFVEPSRARRGQPRSMAAATMHGGGAKRRARPGGMYIHVVLARE